MCQDLINYNLLCEKHHKKGMNMEEESERVKYILKHWSQLQLAREYEKLEKEKELFDFIMTRFNEISCEELKKLHVEGLEITRENGVLTLKPIHDEELRDLETTKERMKEYYECCKKQNKQIIDLQAENKRLKENKLQKEHWMELAKVYEQENKKLKHINEALSCFSKGAKTLNNLLKSNWVHKLELTDLKNYYLNYESPYYEEELIIKELIEKIDEILK